MKVCPNPHNTVPFGLFKVYFIASLQDLNKNFQEVISSLKRCIKCARDKNRRILFMIRIGGHQYVAEN